MVEINAHFDTAAQVSLLIVEDDQDSCEMLVLMLQRHYPTLVTHCSGDGRSGWELFKVHHPKLVITDLSLPQVDGMELARMIRSVSRETKLVAISADLERAALKKPDFNRQIFDHYLAKPFLFGDLVAAIEEVVPLDR